VVVAVAVGAFLLGRNRAPEIASSPAATTGVLWSCRDRFVGTLQFPYAANEYGSIELTGSDGAPHRTIAVLLRREPPGLVVLVEIGAFPVGERVRATYLTENEPGAPAAPVEIEVPVLPCARSPKGT
jgi:hypothetical protein